MNKNKKKETEMLIITFFKEVESNQSYFLKNQCNCM